MIRAANGLRTAGKVMEVAEISVELGRDQRVWVDVFDATGRRVAALADGERRNAGTASWPWTPVGGRAASGTYFWRARGEDGSSVSGRVVVVR